MRGNKIRWLILFILIFFPSALIFSQTEQALEIREKNQTGVVYLTVLGDQKETIAEGSGFVVEQGVMATSYLLVSQAKSVTGKNFKGKKVKIEGILAVDKNLNLALLKIKGKTPALSMGDSDELGMGKKVYAVGVNELGEIGSSEGTVTNILEIEPTKRFVETSLSVPQSFNGAPLIGVNGKVLGMIVFLERRLKFILPSNLMKTVQKKSVIKFKDYQDEDYLATFEGAYLAGKIASLLDETGRAQIYLEKVVELSPMNIEAVSFLASVYNRQRSYQKAASTYQKVIELDNNRVDAHYQLGLVYLRLRKYRDAIAPLQKAVELNLDYEDAHFYTGNAYKELKEFAKAAETYENYLNLKPEDPWEGYFSLGLCRIELKQFEEAITALNEAAKQKPQDIKTNYYLAQAYDKANQYEKAEEAYKLLALLSPEEADKYYKTILFMYDKANNHEKAIEAARSIIELKPDSTGDIYNLGLMYQKQKKYDEAIKTFNEVLAINSADEYSHSNIGYIYYIQKKYSKSIAAFKKFVELFPDKADGWFYIGICNMQLKKFDAALEPLNKTVELRTDYSNGNALYNLAICYLNLHDNYSAKELYNKLTAINPQLAQKLKQHLR
ncbi:MAG TPA: serine protease [Candidatus Aminicenantes bacterium]|nr:serine protease [Candidatus Aminicenantes bacterium]